MTEQALKPLDPPQESKIGVGHNNPPKDPFDLCKEAVDQAAEQASDWDDREVKSQAEADQVATLIGVVRQTKQGVEDARKAAKKPHDDAAKAVQAQYKPELDRCDSLTNKLKRATLPFLKAREDARREAEEKARREAAEADRLAREAVIQARETGDRDARDAAIEKAEKVKAKVKAISKARPQGKADGARAVSLRTNKVAVVTDVRQAARYFWTEEPAAFDDFIKSLADRAVRDGATEIPGVEIREERSVA